MSRRKLIDLQEALRLARVFNPQFQSAVVNTRIARENGLQAKAARLPTVDALNQFTYTEGNGTPSGVFVANDGLTRYHVALATLQTLTGSM